jgi:hypothetical protein
VHSLTVRLAVYAELPERAMRVFVDGACGTECYDVHNYVFFALVCTCSMTLRGSCHCVQWPSVLWKVSHVGVWDPVS